LDSTCERLEPEQRNFIHAATVVSHPRHGRLERSAIVREFAERRQDRSFGGVAATRLGGLITADCVVEAIRDGGWKGRQAERAGDTKPIRDG
jgi:hypothetical protein